MSRISGYGFIDDLSSSQKRMPTHEIESLSEVRTTFVCGLRTFLSSIMLLPSFQVIRSHHMGSRDGFLKMLPVCSKKRNNCCFESLFEED